MSRGPGKWQQDILARLQTQEQFYLWEILPPPPSDRTERRPPIQMAVLRVAHRLAAQGQIALDTRRYWSNYLYHWFATPTEQIEAIRNFFRYLAGVKDQVRQLCGFKTPESFVASLEQTKEGDMKVERVVARCFRGLCLLGLIVVLSGRFMGCATTGATHVMSLDQWEAENAFFESTSHGC